MDIKYNFRIGEFDYGRGAARFYGERCAKNTRRCPAFCRSKFHKEHAHKALHSVQRFRRRSPHNHLI